MSKPYRKAVMGIIINEKEQFLIGSSPRDGGYKFPQGGLKDNEEPVKGIIRELQEELGVLINENHITFELSNTVKYPYPKYKPQFKTFTGQEMNVFVIKHENNFDWKPQDDEFSELFWIKKNELFNFDFQYRLPAYYKALDRVFKKIHLIQKSSI